MGGAPKAPKWDPKAVLTAPLPPPHGLRTQAAWQLRHSTSLVSKPLQADSHTDWFQLGPQQLVPTFSPFLFWLGGFKPTKIDYIKENRVPVF